MINIQYENYLRHIMTNGVYKEDRTGTGTYSVFGYQMRFDLREGFPLITTKKIHTKSIFHELIWFLAGSTNIKYLQDNGVSIWDEWADENGDLGPVYGKQWRSWPGNFVTKHISEMTKEERERNCTFVGQNSRTFQEPIDQIQQALDLLKNNPDSRRIIVTAWNPTEIPNMKLPPCHAFFQFYTEEIPLQARIDIQNARIRDEAAAFYASSDSLHEMRTYHDIDAFLPKEEIKAHEYLNRANIPRRYLSCQLYQRSH